MVDGPTQQELFEAYEADARITLEVLARGRPMVRARPVVCEPCQRGGGPKDCVRPCTHQGGRAMGGSPA